MSIFSCLLNLLIVKNPKSVQLLGFISDGVVFYYSPKAQKALHETHPDKYTSDIPIWATDPKKEIVKISGTENDDFKWFKYKRSKFFITLFDSKGHPLITDNVDVRFATRKKVPALSRLKTNAKGQLPVFYARIEMGVRLVVDGKYVKVIEKNKTKILRILPTGKDLVVSIFINKENGYKAIMKKHTGKVSEYRDSSSLNQSYVSSKSQNINSKDVTFNLKIIEGDTGKPIPNLNFKLGYKNRKKDHNTDKEGCCRNILAEKGYKITVFLNDDNTVQEIFSFDITSTLDGNTKTIKVPVESITIQIKNKLGLPIKNTKVFVKYRGHKREKQTSASGKIQLKALAGQRLSVYDKNGNKLFSNVVTFGKKSWTYNMPSSPRNLNKKTDNQTNVKPNHTIRDIRNNNGHPVTKIQSDEVKFTIQFVDKKTRKPVSGYSYIIKSKKYGERNHSTQAQGKKTHTTVRNDDIVVYILKDNKNIKLDSFVVTSHGIIKTYEVNKPKNYLFPLAIKPTADYKSGIRAFGSRRSSGKRKHAAADLYAPSGTPVRAMESGLVLSCGKFYAGTDFITIKHQNHIIRYGELAPGKLLVKVGDKVLRDQNIGYVGKLKGVSVPSNMLHLEMYSDVSDTSKLTVTGVGANIYKRRHDLINPNPYLDNADK